MRLLSCFAALAAVVVACTPQPSPVVPSPDASDASALGDALSTWDPSCAAAPATCTAACNAMVGAGCVEQRLCPCTLANVDARRLVVDQSITAPGADNHLTCAALAAVKTSADVKVHGWSCGP